MEFVFLLISLVLALWALATASSNRAATEALRRRVDELEDALREPRKQDEPARASRVIPVLPPDLPVRATPPDVVAAPPPPAPEPPATLPPPPPPLPVRIQPYTKAEPAPGIDWEQFMGVKLFAWLGGLALFLGMGFLIKYSFDQGFISPAVRVVFGALAGVGLILGGLRMDRNRYATTLQALCAAGLLILFADTYAAFKFYGFIGHTTALGLMSLVTAAAIVLSIRLEAQSIAVLGLLGGFLTPGLIRAGWESPAALFGYIGLLDAGLIAVALRKRWHHLITLAAGATLLMQVSWVATALPAAHPQTGMPVFLAFAALFLVVLAWAQRRGTADGYIAAGSLLMSVSALLFALPLLPEFNRAANLSPRPFLLEVFCADAALLAAAWWRRELRWVIPVAGTLVFGLLGLWTTTCLEVDGLTTASCAYLLFGVLHAALPVLAERFRPAATPVWWAHAPALAAIVLIAMPIVSMPATPYGLWIALLAAGGLAVGLALATSSVLALLGSVVLTMLTLTVWTIRAPGTLASLTPSLLLTGMFSMFYFTAGVFAARKISRTAEQPEGPLNRFAALATPALSALLPFFLLCTLVGRIPLATPSPVFWMGAALTVLLMGLARFARNDWMPAAGLAGVGLLEWVWHTVRLAPDNAIASATWYGAFYLLFAAFPFVFRRSFINRVVPWAIAAVAAPMQFWLLKDSTDPILPAHFHGLVPALFALPSLGILYWQARALPRDAAKRNTLLALSGGTALFFLTLIFPVQFHRQWITIGWAMEGAALIWLFRRIPHNGLRALGVLLLVAAFVRLSPLNIEQFTYQPRTGTILWNWYLYTYGLVTACLFTGMRWLAPPHDRLVGIQVRAVLAGLGIALAFLLVNIEIADAFSTGTRIHFEFSGHLGRDMTYSLAWAAFAFVVMAVGIGRRVPALRYAGIGLLVITVFKLFLHDVWSLGGLYRIGALIGLALVLIPVSYLYQRFLAPRDKSADTARSP